MDINLLQFPSNMIRDLREGKVLAWIGAGLSIENGFLPWNELITTLATQVGNADTSQSGLRKWASDNASTSPEWVAEVLYSTNNHEFHKALRAQFDGKSDQYTFVHSLLSILPFSGYVTTNYDLLIENNLRHFTEYTPKVYTQEHEDLFQLLNHSEDYKFVFKAHGSSDHSLNRLVLTETEYFSLQGDSLYQKVLSTLFMKYSFIAFGYSLRDRDFRSILNERYNLLKGDCPPFYVFTSIENTCQKEIDCYLNKFNLHIIPVSPTNNYQELKTSLLSIYCLCHRMDMTQHHSELKKLIDIRIADKPLEQFIQDKHDIFDAYKILNAIKDPLEATELASILFSSGITLPTAQIELICTWTNRRNIICNGESDQVADRVAVAKIIKKSLDLIPKRDRFITAYYKKQIDKYRKTIIYLLGHKESFIVLVASEDDFDLVFEYFCQQGLWMDWNDIAQNALDYCPHQIKHKLLESIAEVYFWIRDYEGYLSFFRSYLQPELKNIDRHLLNLKYMTLEGIQQIINIEENSGSGRENDIFNLSLIGRAYGLLSMQCSTQKRENLMKAKQYLSKALELSIEESQVLEKAKQYIYLSLALTELGEIEQANRYLSEARQIDEEIMEWVPGMAWIKVAEYRLAKATNDSSVYNKHAAAAKAMESLGMHQLDEYLEKYFFF